MANNNSYFGGIADALKTLTTGLKTTMKEYFTPKSTEQYPENRKTTLHVSKRHRGRLVFKRDENGAYKCVACTMCEKACPNGTIKITHEMVTDEATGKKKPESVRISGF
jgi:NADH-quinone oxidoreductase subunit I